MVLDEIAAERHRQIMSAGWSAEHDDQHINGELAQAASWHLRWSNPQGARRNLIKAAALIVAEIERIDRLACRPQGGAERTMDAESGSETEIEMVLVPRRPTKEMVDAAKYDAMAEDASAVWETMIEHFLTLPGPTELICRPQGEPAPSPAPTSTAHGVEYEIDTGGMIPSARPQDGG